MLNLEEWMDIRSLRREGHSIKQIVRLTGHSRNTVRKTLRQKEPADFKSSERTSKLDPYKDYLRERFLATGLSAQRLFGEVRPMGYDGSVITVRRFIATLRPEVARKAKLTVRFETPPGKQAQVDWMYCGRFALPSGAWLPVYAFVMVLCFSRMLFAAFTTSMKLSTFLRCHREASSSSAVGRSRSSTTT
jgi:transposase